MLATGKCPSCGNVAQRVNVDTVEIRTSDIGGPVWDGLSYKCPSCNTILSVSIDPAALKTVIVKEILARLGR